ncbi:hypothetical protein BT67DRAFT_417930 [Trichocladium antarcticum]|uniref:Uncharacterized protein n=1 Tax=Trichocladium antarcticum TaxID=1450529 RepID=A0AAN6ZF33_9PEZI|nr:hypothetical protein BT67DRAFT_417930 [Trichocladium antarcticum]
MALLHARNLIAFPGGDNASDTLIGSVHLNRTALELWNFTLYSNGTLSNGSKCILTFAPHAPAYLFPNGSFTNDTSCYSPVNPIGTRAGIAIGYAVVFGVALVLTLVNLNKHGSLHLPAEKRFYPIGRRWQWYWASWACATAMVSLLTCVDVDRYYLPELPLVLTNFFWYLMQMGAMAIVWEAVRHWGSWMERQFIDPDPFALRDDDWRSKIEFWLPLVFYLFLWLNFFMVIPRNWGDIEHQRYPEQIINEAMPTATDTRFKVAAFFLVVCWLITVFSLRHSIKHYCPRNRGIINRIVGFIRYMPARFMLVVPLAAVVPAYQALIAWEFPYSPLNLEGDQAAIYAGGYTPTLLILFIQVLFGFFRPNEDLELQHQRRVRGQELDREMGIVHKPSWWRRMNGEYIPANESMRERLDRNVREINGNRAPAAPADAPATNPVELGPVSPTRPTAKQYTGRSGTRRREREAEIAAGMLFPDASERSAAAMARRHAELMMDGPPSRAPFGGGSTGSTNQPPQQIRSMLDV